MSRRPVTLPDIQHWSPMLAGSEGLFLPSFALGAFSWLGYWHYFIQGSLALARKNFTYTYSELALCLTSPEIRRSSGVFTTHTRNFVNDYTSPSVPAPPPLQEHNESYHRAFMPLDEVVPRVADEAPAVGVLSSETRMRAIGSFRRETSRSGWSHLVHGLPAPT